MEHTAAASLETIRCQRAPIPLGMTPRPPKPDIATSSVPANVGSFHKRTREKSGGGAGHSVARERRPLGAGTKSSSKERREAGLRAIMGGSRSCSIKEHPGRSHSHGRENASLADIGGLLHSQERKLSAQGGASPAPSISDSRSLEQDETGKATSKSLHA